MIKIHALFSSNGRPLYLPPRAQCVAYYSHCVRLYNAVSCHPAATFDQSNAEITLWFCNRSYWGWRLVLLDYVIVEHRGNSDTLGC